MEDENITGTISLSNGIENADTFGAGVQSASETNADREAIIERATTPSKQNWADRVPYVIMPKKKAKTNSPVEQKKPLYSVPNIGEGMDFYGMRITQDALNAAYKRANEYKPSKKQPTQTDEDQARFDYGIMAVSIMGSNAKLDGSDLFGTEDGFKDMTWSQKRDRLVQAFNAGGMEYTLPSNIRDAMIISRGIDSQENGLIKAKGLGELYALAQANGYDNQSGTALSRGVSSMFPNRKREMALAAKPYLAPQIQEKIEEMTNPMRTRISSPEGVLKMTSAEWDKITEINKQLDIVNQYMKEVREKTAFLYKNKIYDLIGKPSRDLLEEVESGKFASPWFFTERNFSMYDKFMSLPERDRALIEPLIKIYNKSENTWFHDATEAVMSPFADIVRAGYSNTIRLFYDDETYQAYMEYLAKATAFATPEAKDWNLLGEGLITLGNIAGYAATMSNPVGVVATQQAVANRNSLEAAGRGIDVSSWKWILESNAEAAANIAMERLQGKAIFGKLGKKITGKTASNIPDRKLIDLAKASFSGKGRKHLVKAIAGQTKTIPGEVIGEVVQDSMDTALVSGADVASRKANGDGYASYMDAVEETAETALDTVTNPGLWMGMAFGSAIAPMTVAARKAIKGKEYRLLSQEDANNLIGSLNSLSNEIEGRTIEATKQGVALYGQNTTRIDTITKAREVMEANSAIKEYVEGEVRKLIAEKVVPFQDFIRFLYMDYGVDIASGLLKEGVFKKDDIESDGEGVKITGETAAFAQNLNELIKTKEFSDVLGIKEIEGDRVISQFVDNELKSGHIMNENGEEYLFTYRDGKPFMVRYEEKEYKPIDPDTTDANLIREIARNAVERNGEDPGDTAKVNDAIKKWKELSRESRAAFVKSLRVNGSFVATKEGERAKYSDGTPIVGTITFYKGSDPAEAIHEYSHAVIPNLIEEANNGRDEAKKFLEAIVKVYGGKIDKDESGKITNLKIDTEEAFVRDIKRVAERAAETRGASLKYKLAPENVDLSSRIYMHFDRMLDSIFRVAEKYRMHRDSETFSEATLKFVKSGKIDLNASVEGDVERLASKRKEGERPAENAEENKETASAMPVETAPTPEPPDDENAETVDADTTESDNAEAESTADTQEQTVETDTESDSDKSEEKTVPEAGTDTAISSDAGTNTEDTENVQAESEKTEDEQASDSDSSIAEYVERERVTEVVNNVFAEKTGEDINDIANEPVDAEKDEQSRKEPDILSESLRSIVSKVEESDSNKSINDIADALIGKKNSRIKIADDVRISVIDEMAKLIGVDKVVTGNTNSEARKQIKDAIEQIIHDHGKNAEETRQREIINDVYAGAINNKKYLSEIAIELADELNGEVSDTYERESYTGERVMPVEILKRKATESYKGDFRKVPGVVGITISVVNPIHGFNKISDYLKDAGNRLTELSRRYGRGAKLVETVDDRSVGYMAQIYSVPFTFGKSKEGLGEIKIEAFMGEDASDYENRFSVTSADNDIRYSISGIYTGSAADYEKPSLHYVGTGAGDQVYGWGLYGSNQRGVAENYASMSAHKEVVVVDGKEMRRNEWSNHPKGSPEWIALGAVEFGGRNFNKERIIEQILNSEFYAEFTQEQRNAAIEYLRSHEFGRKKRSENIYEQTFFTDRAPGDESHLLKWYEPVSDENVKRVISQYAKENGGADILVKTPSGTITVDYFESRAEFNAARNEVLEGLKADGQSLYEYLSKVLGSPKAASEFLARAGIDGVKYPVESYGKTVKDGDEAGWNYVSFRDDNIRVDHKWTAGEMRYSVSAADEFTTPSEDAKKAVGADGVELMTGGKKMYSVSSGARGIGVDYDIDNRGRAYFYHYGDRGRRITNDDPITADEILSSKSSFTRLMKLANGKISKQERTAIASLYADIINKAVEYVGDNENGVAMLNAIWKWAGASVFKSVKANGDAQYSLSIDLTTICKKTEQILNAVSAFQVMNRRGCTPAEMMQIYLQTGKAGFQTPCPCCYVFSHWIRSGLLLQTAWAAQNEFKKYLKTADEFNRLSEAEKAEYEKKWKAILKEEVDFAENNKILIGKAKELLDSSLLLIDRFGSIVTGKNYTKEQKDIAKDRIKEISPLVNAAYQIISRSDYAGWIKSNMFDKSGRLLGMQTKESDGKAYDFTPVDPDILFAYNRADELVAKYPAMARFRVSKGSAGGKAVETDADNAFGEVISGLAKRTDNPFETGDEEAQSNAYGSAIAFAARQNLRGGCRIFSWSDNLMKFGPDMFWNFVQLQAVGSGVQSYSKQLEGVELICAMGGYNNGSLIAKGDGYEDCNEGDEGAVLNPVNGKYQRLVFSDVQGINHKELFVLNKKYDKSGNILVGMSDEHIALALSDKRIFFVIPWHSSSLRKEFLNLMMDMLGESRASDSQDYTSVQGDGAWKGKGRAITDFWKNECYREKDSNNNVLRSAFRVDVADGALSDSQKKYRALRERIILGEATEEDIKTAKKDTFLSAVVKALKNAADGIPKKYRTRYYVNKKNGLLIMNKDDSKSIYPYEYWDENSTYENQDANGERYLEYCRRLGFVPKFCGFTKDGSKLNFGDFHNLHGYPKLLIDRRMYDRSGKYQGVESVRASGMEMRMITKEGLEDTWTREIVDKNGNKVRKSLITVVADKDSAMKIAEDVMKHNASNKVSIKKFKNVKREDIVDAAQKAVDSFGNLGFKTDGSPKSGVDPVEEIVDGLRRSVTFDHSRPMSNAALCAAAIAEDMIRNHGKVYDKEKEHKALVKFLYGTKSDEETQKKYNKAVEKAGKLFNKFQLDSGDKLFERLARESNVLTIKEDIQKILTNKVDDALDIADGAQKAVNKVLADIAYNTDEYKVKEIIESSGVDPIALLEALPVENKDSSKRSGKKDANLEDEDLGINKGKSFEDLTPEEKEKFHEKMLKKIQEIEAVKKAWLEYISANKEDIDKRAKKVKPKSRGKSQTGAKTAEEVVNQNDNYEDTDMVNEDTIPDIKEEYKEFFDSLNSSGLKIENVYQLSELLRWWVEYRFEHTQDGSLTEDAFEKYRRTMVAVLNYMLKELVSLKTNQSNGMTFNKVYENTQAILKARDAETVQLLTYRSLRMIQYLRSKAVKSNVIKGLRAFLDGVAPKKQANNALEKDLNRKITALMQFKARYIRAAVLFTPGEIENQIKRLNEIIEKRTAETKRAIGEENGDVSNENVESRVSVDVEVVRAYIKLAIIDKYGGLYRKSVKDVEDAAEEIKKYFNEEAYAHAKLLEEWNAYNETFKEAVIRATEDPKRTTKPDDTFWRGLVGLSVATIRQRLQFAFRAKLRDKNTVILIDRICGMLSDGYNKLCKTKLKYKKQLNGILNKSVAGTGKTVRDMLKLLDTKCDFDLNQKLIEKSKQKIRMTWGQVLQLYVSLLQKSSFEDAIKANGREGQDAIIRERLNNYPELLRLAEGLREAYRERRAELSEEFKKITGHEINSPDPFYMPVRRYVKNGEGLDTIVSAWDPFGKTFTPRIKSLNDFDLTASIVPLFIQREQESARVIAYGVLGMRLRAIFGSSEVKEAIANSVGDDARDALIKQITDFLSDGFKNPGDNKRVKEVMETLGTVTTYMGLSWNVNSTLKQMTSIFTFVSVIDGGFPKVMKYILDRDRTAVEEFVSSDGFASRYGDTSFKEVFLNAWRDNRSSVLKKIYQSGMTLLQLGDYFPSMLVGPGLYKERRDELINQGVNPNEARAQAARETWEKIEEVQQTSRLDMTLEFMRRQGVVAKSLTQFASSPLLQMSQEVHCARMALDAYRRGDWQQAKVWRRRAVNMIICNNVIMPPIMLMVSELFGMAIGGDEPDKDEFIGTLIASMISGPFSRVLALGILADGTGETVARILGYKPKISDSSQIPINQTIKNATRLLKAISTDLADHDWSSIGTDFLDVVSQAFRPAAYARTILNNAVDYDPKAERAKRKRAIAKARKEENDGSDE